MKNTQMLKPFSEKALPLRDKDAARVCVDYPNVEAAEDALKDMAKRIDALQDLLWANQKHSVLLVLQGMDTSGKDGTVRAVFARTSPLGLRVANFKAPTEDERRRDFLWRVHAHVPARGEIGIFNRSHYEDVLVPWVNGWIDKTVYAERIAAINDFENLLVANGTVIVKCFLHISKAEQARRLQERIDNPAKHWKFSLGDLEVRKQWADYQKAYERLLPRTSSKQAPWYVVPADDKLQRNLAIAQLVIAALEGLKLKPAPANPAFKGLVVV